MWLWAGQMREAAMDASYGFARVIAGFLGFTSLVGVVWFGAALTGLELSGGLVLGLTSLAVALIPKRTLNHARARRAAVTLCFAGVTAGMILVAQNLAPPYPIEWDVVAINLLNISALVAIATKARRLAKR